MPTHIEYGVEILRFRVRKLDGMGKSFLCRFILLEPRHRGSLIFWQIALRVDRRLSAFRRGERQLYTGIPEKKIGGREFFEPEPGFATRVAQLIVGCEHHQDFHLYSWHSVLLSVGETSDLQEPVAHTTTRQSHMRSPARFRQD